MNDRKGFTLMELIVTIAILVTLMTIVAPSLSGFAGSARDQVSDANLELLNFATRSYASFHEIENEDVFKSIADQNPESDGRRQQVLVSDGLIDQAVAPSGEGGYCWNVTDQKWIRYYDDQRVGCGGSFTPEENGESSLSPDPIATPEPSAYPSANPQPTALPTNEQTACVTSQGTYDRLNKTCSCPSGMVLEGKAEIDGKEYPACIRVEEYMCAQSGGKFENNACVCPDGYEYKEETKMCAVIPVSDKDKCQSLGGVWNADEKKCELNKPDFGFDYDPNNPNFIYAAYALGGTDDDLFTVFASIKSYAEIQRSGSSVNLAADSYFYHNNQVYRVVHGVTITDNESFEDFIGKSGTAQNIANISQPDYQAGIYYRQNAFVRLNGVWYQAKWDLNVNSNPETDTSNWNKCEADFKGCKLKP